MSVMIFLFVVSGFHVEKTQVNGMFEDNQILIIQKFPEDNVICYLWDAYTTRGDDNQLSCVKTK